MKKVHLHLFMTTFHWKEASLTVIKSLDLLHIVMLSINFSESVHVPCSRFNNLSTIM